MFSLFILSEAGGVVGDKPCLYLIGILFCGASTTLCKENIRNVLPSLI